MRLPRHRLIDVYVAVPFVFAVAILWFLVQSLDLQPVVDRPAETLVIAALVVLGELWPVTVPRKRETEHITPSDAFVFALLLLCGLGPAVIVLVLGSLLADVVHRRPLRNAVLNVGQYTISLTVAAVVLAALQGRGWATPAGRAFTAPDLLALAASCLAWFVANNTLTGVAVALAQGIPTVPFLRQDLAFRAGVTFMQLALAPVVVATADLDPLLVPLLMAPILAVRLSASLLVEKEHQARHDQLTELPNRRYFYERVEEEIARRRRQDDSAAVLLIDLDRFKEVNDTLGHQVGDLVLQEIGPRLRQAVRVGDLVARLGGDEFGVLLPSVGSPRTAAEIADRILRALGEPVPLPDMLLDIDASVGIALFPAHGRRVEDLLQRADVAMYLAKEARTGFEVYSDERDPYSARRLLLHGELRRAMGGPQLVVHYQPKVRLSDGLVLGVEALVRWRHPERGLMLPESFLPLAERIGLGPDLTRHVLGEALKQCRAWHDAGHAYSMAVNLSVRNLHDRHFPQLVADSLVEHGLEPGDVEFEVPEGALMADLSGPLDVLHALREMGVKLALDDFGKGYSSLTYLRHLPVDELKIDKTFVMNVAVDESDEVIVRSTIDLARSLGLSTVAEGVETAEVWNKLLDLNCEIAQGFLLSEALPAAELDARLEQLELQSGRIGLLVASEQDTLDLRLPPAQTPPAREPTLQLPQEASTPVT